LTGLIEPGTRFHEGLPCQFEYAVGFRIEVEAFRFSKQRVDAVE
jgi:hypothetical protein